MILRGGDPERALPVVSGYRCLGRGAHIRELYGLAQADFNHPLPVLDIVGRNGRTVRIGGVHQHDAHLGRAGVGVAHHSADGNKARHTVAPSHHHGPALVDEMVVGSAGYCPGKLCGTRALSRILHRVALAGEHTVQKVRCPETGRAFDIVHGQAFRVEVGADVQPAPRLGLHRRQAAQGKHYG